MFASQNFIRKRTFTSQNCWNQFQKLKKNKSFWIRIQKLCEVEVTFC